MKINPKMEQALNKQVNAELSAFYSYLSMAAYFKFHFMPGCARWFNAQASEEFKHAMKLNEYIMARGGKVILSALEAPQTQWESSLAVLEGAYAQELKVSALLNELMELAKNEQDHATEVMLQWFVSEQVEEEGTAETNIERFRLLNSANAEIVEFDRELGERKL